MPWLGFMAARLLMILQEKSILYLFDVTINFSLAGAIEHCLYLLWIDMLVVPSMKIAPQKISILWLCLKYWRYDHHAPL